MNTHTEGTKVYSYGTHVATIDHEQRTVTAHGKWSKTTTRHIADAARELGYAVTKDQRGQAGSTKVSGQTFGAQRMGIVKEDRDTATADPLPVLRMFAALASMGHDPEQAQRERERMVFATPGIIRPDGWDSLSYEERKRRTDAALNA